MDTRGEPDTFAMDRHEIWDVALKVVAADAKSFDAWFSVAPDATGKVRVSRHDWKPITTTLSDSQRRIPLKTDGEP